MTNEEWLKLVCEGTAFDRMAYADWLEDQGRVKEAGAWRVIAREGYYPYIIPLGGGGGGGGGGGSSDGRCLCTFYDAQSLESLYRAYQEEVPLILQRSMLPGDLLALLPSFRKQSNNRATYHDDPVQAMKDLAWAILKYHTKETEEDHDEA